MASWRKPLKITIPFPNATCKRGAGRRARVPHLDRGVDDEQICGCGRLGIALDRVRKRAWAGQRLARVLGRNVDGVPVADSRILESASPGVPRTALASTIWRGERSAGPVRHGPRHNHCVAGGGGGGGTDDGGGGGGAIR